MYPRGKLGNGVHYVNITARSITRLVFPICLWQPRRVQTNNSVFKFVYNRYRYWYHQATCLKLYRKKTDSDGPFQQRPPQQSNCYFTGISLLLLAISIRYVTAFHCYFSSFHRYVLAILSLLLAVSSLLPAISLLLLGHFIVTFRPFHRNFLVILSLIFGHFIVTFW